MPLFQRAQFRGLSDFRKAQFSENATFEEARFFRNTTFGDARFESHAWFDGTTFAESGFFRNVYFGGHAAFRGSRFEGDVWFRQSAFSVTNRLGPILARSSVVLDSSTFGEAVLVEVSTPSLTCVSTKFEGAATLRARWASILLDGAVFSRSSTISMADTFRRDVFGYGQSAESDPRELFDESSFAASQAVRPQVLSMRRADASNLVLADVSLGSCIFQGAHNLDQLRIEGTGVFEYTPTAVRIGRAWPFIWRWTRRQVLAEEQELRASSTIRPRFGSHDLRQAGWHALSKERRAWLERRTGQPVQAMEADRLAPLYRRLRKAREDGKDEPGAADFYYGEMEMRRLASRTSWGERVVLTLYWLASGYGLRAVRSLVALLLVIVVAALLFGAVGIVHVDSHMATFWVDLLYAARSTVSLTDSEVRLTQWGKLLQLVLRLIGPVLLGLGLLAVRNRVKR